jgi:hypothetical protein
MRKDSKISGGNALTENQFEHLLNNTAIFPEFAKSREIMKGLLTRETKQPSCDSATSQWLA